MNPLYNDTPIFNRRKEEWNPPVIKSHIDRMFNTISLLDGWTYHGSEWTDIVKPKKKEDLKKSIYSVLKCKISDPSGREFEYPLQIPNLHQDQFFYIGGFLKVPIFQLFDHPVIYRMVRSGTILKLRTNSMSITAELNRKDNIPHIELFNKTVPLFLMLAAAHNKEDIDQFKQQHPNWENIELNGNPFFVNLFNAVEEQWNKQLSEEEVACVIGEYFMNQPSEKLKKGVGTLFSLKVAYNVDHFSQRYFHTDSLLFEILHAIYNGPRSDTDLNFKRIRFSEYVLAPLIHKIYDMIVTLQKHHRDKYQIPQNIILEHVNSSDGKDIKNAVASVVHYNNTINPVSEIASFLQCSLVGPGGFKKDNVPPHLRNMDESQYGLLCAADTPDREGCGVIHNMVPTIKLDEIGNFGEINDNNIVSFPISLVPFLQNDDPTRLQMSSNQTKQTIMLSHSQAPWIRSGNEGLYLEHTTFQHIAKEEGIVIHIDPSFMVVVYDKVSPKQVDIFQIKYRSLYLNTIDYIEPRFEVGQRFSKDEILCQSRFIKDGELAMGQNLLTAVMIYKGFNYEDGIVIAESVVKKMASVHSVDLSFNIDSGQVLLSLCNDEYKPVPKIGQILQKGETYAKIKNLNWEEGFDNINEEPNEQKAPLNCKIISMDIYPNCWNKQVSEFTLKIEELINNQLVRYNLIVNSLSPYMSKTDIEKFMLMNGLSTLNCDDKHQGNIYNKGTKISGILIKMKGIYEEEIGIGDKVANRHGNKGVIAKVVPDSEMPKLKDGRTVEIVINPLGIISRMNVGQLYELHLGEAVYQLRQKMYQMSQIDAKAYLKKFLKIFETPNTKWCTDTVISKFDNNVRKENLKYAIDNICVIMPPFQSATPEQLDEAMMYTGASYKYSITDGDQPIQNDIACGYMYFNKLVHRASDKVSARSIGPYNRKTSQPMGGKSNQGGHRLGEMEVWALLAHNAKDFLKDLLTVHSDSIGLKNKVLSDILQNPSLTENEDQDIRPQSLRILEAYLNIMGLTIVSDQDGNIADILNQTYDEILNTPSMIISVNNAETTKGINNLGDIMNDNDPFTI